MDFAIKLFRKVENEGERKNYVVAPLSPQILLSFLANASQGKTNEEIVKVTGYSDSTTLEKLLNEMQGDGTKRELKIGNAFFISSTNNKK